MREELDGTRGLQASNAALAARIAQLEGETQDAAWRLQQADRARETALEQQQQQHRAALHELERQVNAAQQELERQANVARAAEADALTRVRELEGRVDALKAQHVTCRARMQRVCMRNVCSFCFLLVLFFLRFVVFAPCSPLP